MAEDKITLDTLIEEYTGLIKSLGNSKQIGVHCDFSNYEKLKEVKGKFKTGFEGGEVGDINEIWAQDKDKKLINAVSNKCRLTTCLIGNDEAEKNENLTKVAKNIYAAFSGLNIDKGNDWEAQIASNERIAFDYTNLLKNDVQAFVKELFYVVNIKVDNWPLWNGCTKNAVRYLKQIEDGWDDKGNFEIIKEVKEKIKNALNATDNKYPYYYLTDKFFNLLDKLKEKEIGNEDEDNVKLFYQNVWNYLQKSESAKDAKTKISNDLFTILEDSEGKNIILYGPPGTSKTFGVENTISYILKKEIGNEKNDGDLTAAFEERVTKIQFHPSYEYEDFIQGYKPVSTVENKEIKFELKDGHFKKFVDKAIKDEENTYFFIIDEINRADLSKVLGELMYCLEKRGEKINLKYSEEDFFIPKNIHVIGTMNTTDKSVDAFDIALRRRFIWLYRTYDEDVLTEILADKLGRGDVKIKELVDFATTLNEKIVEHPNLGENFVIGHAIFLNAIEENIKGEKKLQRHPYNDLQKFHLKPLLKEYLRFSVDNEKELTTAVDELLKLS